MTISTASASANVSKLTRADHKLFRGTAAEVHSWMSNAEILGAVGANFEVERVAAHGPSGIAYPECQLWRRSDTKALLGSFGQRRKVIQPEFFVDFFRSFCDASDKEISLDVVGSLNGGKTFYMASKLTDKVASVLDAGGGMGIARRGSDAYLEREDRTDFWLVISDFYGESLSPKAVIFSNELICTNGMARKVTDSDCKLTHLRSQREGEVHAVLQRALQESRAYAQMKDRLTNTPITMETAKAALKSFFSANEGENATVQRLEKLYTGDLIGNDLPERQGTAWGLLSAVTEYTSHSRSGNGDATLRSQLDGARARTNTKFAQHLEQLLAIA